MNPERNLFEEAVDPDSPPVTKRELKDFVDEFEDQLDEIDRAES